MKLFFLLFAAGLFLLGLNTGCNKGVATGFDHFITAKDGRLYDGDREFRFISYNIPNLHYVEDNMAFEETNPFRFPDEFEIRDALLSIRQMGGQVVRLYTLSVRRPDDPDDMPRHISGPGQFNEQAFVALDKCLQIANEYGVRLIIPFVDNWKWWGGRGEYAAFRGKDKEAFWTDPEIISDFKETISFVVNRKNTFTGVAYKNDKAILAWETGNELTSPPAWVAEISAFIKSIDSNHLVIDGTHGSVLRNESLNDPNIDVVTTHHYQKDADEIVALVKKNALKAGGKKPYFVGEFGFIDTQGVRRVLDAVIDGPCSGALIWSLRGHNTDGGFYWHSEPYGGNLFKSYHWPGFRSGDAFDEINCVALLREKAFEIRGQALPALTPPAAPQLLPIKDVAAITWRGSAGASGYDIQRAEEKAGPWTTIAENVSDADVQYRPLYNDETAEIGKRYFYRIIAVNAGGTSAPSNIASAPAVAHHTLVDECRDWNQTHKIYGTLTIKNDEARRSKEDAHRFLGGKGDAVVYRCDDDMASFRIFTFFPEEAVDLLISGSTNGAAFAPISFERADYYSGTGEYGYYKPALFSAKEMPQGIKYLKIEFPATAELSRIEIKYGH